MSGRIYFEIHIDLTKHRHSTEKYANVRANYAKTTVYSLQMFGRRFGLNSSTNTMCAGMNAF